MENIKKVRKSKRNIKKIFLILGIIIFSLIFTAIESTVFYFAYINTTNVLSNMFRLFNAIFSISMVLLILSRNYDLKYKLSWILVIYFFPNIGVTMYFILGSYVLSKKEKERLRNIESASQEYIENDYEILDSIKNENAYKNFNYLINVSKYPIYKNEEVEYFGTGKEFFDSLILDMENAKKYIFLSFHIINEGDLLEKVLEILYEKARSNVKVIIIFDDLASRFKKPKRLVKSLQEHGIEVLKFNSNIFYLAKYLSFRDHKKLAIIDGKVAYTGGVNIADEYTNQDEKYGYWKDTGIKILGESIKSYIVMFGRTYEYIKKERFDYDKYLRNVEKTRKRDGYIMNICDNPDCDENILENMYINFISNANNYIVVTTPYLILSEPLYTALANASKSGVKVKLITPGVPDKKFVNKATKSYYQKCLKEGIEIYEYSLGFIHSKLFLCDDILAVCGSMNLDYRSLKLSFENASILYQSDEIDCIKEDIDKMLENSNKIILEEFKKRSIFQKLIEKIARLFSSIM